MERRTMTEPFAPTDAFAHRHIGPRDHQIPHMLETVGFDSIEAMLQATVPAGIRMDGELQGAVGAPRSESEALAELRRHEQNNPRWRSYIGCGYYGTLVPPVIQRNVLENPGWYTQYTPYQAEISQGRLEALLNFQTMIVELTGLAVANASLLDEGTAAAEAMTLCLRSAKKRTGRRFLVDDRCHPQTLEVLRTRALPINIDLVFGRPQAFTFDRDVFGCLLAYPDTEGAVLDRRAVTAAAHAAGALVAVVTDPLALCVLEPPGAWGADIAVGSTQRFGVPLGFGGPHAAFIACTEALKRRMPGRIIGISKDAHGNRALRMALQTREQHIRRDRATSNICTSQVLLAIMAGLYATYHGADGLRAIAGRVKRMTDALRGALEAMGYCCDHPDVFDTLTLSVGEARARAIHAAAAARSINLRPLTEDRITLSLDETVCATDLDDLIALFAEAAERDAVPAELADRPLAAPLARTTPPVQHPVFAAYQHEHEMLRYLNKLQSRDLSLTGSMIPLGSCTMKLNATAQMIPVSWPGLADIHPFAPKAQTAGYAAMIEELEAMLAEVTGMAAVSLQPNAGSQGEFAGMLAISAYQKGRGEGARNICLIPASAHGTNPASAVMAGLQVVVVACDDRGNVDLQDLRTKAAEHSDDLAAIMVTYPSTHGVFEEGIVELCSIVHEHGGQVYLDGANMNAQVGLCRPGDYGADVMHLNLHKTFAIPHGGGGPGIGPIAVAEHLAPYLPGHALRPIEGADQVGAVSAAPYGSAGVLCITWMYLKLLGASGLRQSSEVAILSANYLQKRLGAHYDILYTGPNGTVAHEFILDLRPLKAATGVDVVDVAKRLMDYGFHAPTMAFPVPGTLMIEPTESESLKELDRLVDALVAIRGEIAAVESGQTPYAESPLANAPHTAKAIASDTWEHPYSRSLAAFPSAHTRDHKYWPTVGRIDEAFGDRNLVCTCPPLDTYT
jgi:glycine dehydrogenase